MRQLAMIAVVGAGMAVAGPAFTGELWQPNERYLQYAIEHSTRLVDVGNGEALCDLAAEQTNPFGFVSLTRNDLVTSSLSGRFVAVYGVVEHERNPNPEGAYARRQQPDFDPRTAFDRAFADADTVLAVIDVEDCLIVNLVNVNGEGLAQFSDDDSVLFVGDGRLHIYTGPGFRHHSGSWDYEFWPSEERWVYWFENNYFAVATVGAGWLVVMKDPIREQYLVRYENTPEPLEEYPDLEDTVSGDCVKRQPEGEVLIARSPIFADQSAFVLEYQTELRSRGKTTKSRRFLFTVDVEHDKGYTEELPQDAEELEIDRDDGNLRCSYHQPGAAKTTRYLLEDRAEAAAGGGS